MLGNEKDFLEGTKQIELTLPQWPPSSEYISYPELSCWKIEYQTSKNSGVFTVDSSQKSISFTVNENQCAAFLAFPITKHEKKETSFFKPAGCIYPQNEKCFLWEQGFAADILFSLYKASENRQKTFEYLSVFNWQRLIDSLNNKESDSVLKIQTDASSNVQLSFYHAFYNQWNLEKSAILTAIAEKSFNVYKLNQPSCIILCDESENVLQIGSTKNLISSYIPENEVFQKYNFVSIIKKTEDVSTFLCYNNLVSISVTSSGKAKISLCSIP